MVTKRIKKKSVKDNLIWVSHKVKNLKAYFFRNTRSKKSDMDTIKLISSNTDTLTNDNKEVTSFLNKSFARVFTVERFSNTPQPQNVFPGTDDEN